MSKEKKTKRRAFTEADFTQIRLLLDAGLTDKQVMLATGRSHFIVSNIHGAKAKGYSDGMQTFADYRKFLAAHSAKYFNTPKVEEVKQEEKSPEPQPQEDNSKAKTVVELLKSIDKHLEDLVKLKRSAIEYAKAHKRGPFFRKFLS